MEASWVYQQGEPRCCHPFFMDYFRNESMIGEIAVQVAVCHM